MQGRKGVGRYAASILGTDLLLETITPEGEKTTLFVEWSAFEAATYLDDVEILIETDMVSEPSGTRLSISGNQELLGEWTQQQFDKLRFELKKLISPVGAAISEELHDDEFHIKLKIEGFPDVEDVIEAIEPFPIFDLFDYRIAGRIGADGKGTLLYSLQKARNTTDEAIPFFINGMTGCGELYFDFRVYDRDKDAIDFLIKRGLKDDAGNYLGKNQARQLLTIFNGIGVYRNGFRIRPLGDPGFDWLELDKKRVQNPSRKIGSDQVIGYVLIQSEELSGLIEKSARDGLKQNNSFLRLKDISEKVIAKLEEKRFIYRQKAGISRPAMRIEKDFDNLFSFENMKKDVRSKLSRDGIDTKTTDEIIEIINQDAQDKNKVADEIRQAVAIYQGQATLGKIINVILHEGRRPLSYFRNQIPRIRKKIQEFETKQIISTANELREISEGIGNNAENFVVLFSRLDPLASGKRTARKPLPLKKTILNTVFVFDEEMKTHNVGLTVEGPDDFQFSSWQQDISAIFTNLIDNSIYWMNEKSVSNRQITIEIVIDGNELLHVDYRDTGPGIEPELIANEVIFEPHFSTKPSGTGLGLAIAGEAAARNGLELRALESDSGAYFRLQPINKEEKDG
ncbi:MAG: ATP-binding protein, partial [Lentimicrobium sp.]|nr:ATP-binding protein [Lentimicrobium sp.]